MHFIFTTMSNRTGISLHIKPSDEKYFEDLLEETSDSTFAGLLSGSVGDVNPSDLEDYAEKKFFGMHGSHAGDYPAHVVCCNGDGHIYEHPCDEDGRLSMYSADPWSLGDAPIQIPTHTMQFLLVARGIVRSMVDEVAEEMVERLAAIEASEAAAKKSGDIRTP